MKRRFIITLALLILLLGVTLLCACGDKPTEGLTYRKADVSDTALFDINYNFDEFYIVSGIDNDNVKRIVIPATYDGWPVLAIDEHAFKNCTNLREVTIPEGLLLIDDSAFENCEKLKWVSMGSTVKIIGEHAFSGCTQLRGFRTLSDELISVRKGAFDGCDSLRLQQEENGLQFLGDPDNPYTILLRASDTDIESVTLTEQTRIVMAGAFKSCASLRSLITHKDADTFIAKGALEDCPIEFAAISSNMLDRLPKQALQTLVLHSGTYVQEKALAYCVTLKYVTLPATLKHIESQAFIGCTALSSVKLEQGSRLVYIDDYAFEGCMALKEISLHSELPLERIGDYAFSYCMSLTRLHIPKATKEIGDGISAGCVSLEQITVAEGNEVYHAQNNCLINTDREMLIAGCKESTIPTSGVRFIATAAFKDCLGLTELSIPNTVEQVVYGAFDGCPIQKASLPTRFLSIIDPTYLTELTLLAGGEASTPGLTNFRKLQKITLSNAYTIISAYTFSGLPELTTVVIGADSALSSIGVNSFKNCSKLTSIRIPKGVVIIGDGAFEGCTSLKTIHNDSALQLEKGSTEHGYVAYYADTVTNSQ